MGIIFRQSSSPNTGPSSVKGTELTWQEADGNWAYLESINAATQASFNAWTGSINSKFSGTSSFALTASYLSLQDIANSAGYANDLAAAAAGIPIGGVYRNGNFLVIRVS